MKYMKYVALRATAKLWGQVGALEDIVSTVGNKHAQFHTLTWYSFQVKLHVWLEQWKVGFHSCWFGEFQCINE